MSKPGEYKRPHSFRVVVDDALKKKVRDVNAMLIREGHGVEGKNCSTLTARRLGLSQTLVSKILRGLI